MKNLIIKWTVSRGHETYGWNICTLWDGKKRYAANGGGYDMLGTVFGMFLQANYMELLKTLKPFDRTETKTGHTSEGYYGLFQIDSLRNGELFLDGACGLDSMITIAKAIGLNVRTLHNKKGHKTNILIEEKE